MRKRERTLKQQADSRRTTILSANYARALQRSTTESVALWRALSAYNSGSESRSHGYAEQVLTGRAAHASRRGF